MFAALAIDDLAARLFCSLHTISLSPNPFTHGKDVFSLERSKTVKKGNIVEFSVPTAVKIYRTAWRHIPKDCNLLSDGGPAGKPVVWMPENIRCNSAQERDMEPVHRLTFCLI
jgi:hypothetical protein